MNEDMSSDKQWMWINEHNQYKICAKTTSENMKTWIQHDSEKFQWKNYMNYTSYYNEATIW